MAKIFSTQFHKGSYISEQGDVNVNTNGSFSRTGKGLAWYNDGTADIALASPITLSRNAATIEVWFKASEIANDRWILGYNVNSYKYLGFTIGNLRIESNTNGDSWLLYALNNLRTNTWYHLLIVADSGTVNSYLNNVLIDTTTPSDDITFQTIGNYSGKTRDWLGWIGKVAFDDEVISSQQRQDNYEEFLHANPMLDNKFPKYGMDSKPINDDNPNALAHFNFIQVGGEFIDITNNGNDITVNKATSTFNGAKLADHETIGDIGNVKTVAFRIKLDSTSEKILEGDPNAHLIYANAGTLTYPDFDNAFVDGIDTDTVVADQWHNVVITSSTNVNMTDVELALNNTTTGNYEIEDLAFYDLEATLSKAIEYHNSFAKRVVLDEKYEFDSVGANLPIGWIKGTGTYEIKELAVQDGVLKHLDVGSKYLEATGAGTIAIPQNKAYFTFEVDVYKEADANLLGIQIISSKFTTWHTSVSYFFYIDNGERVRLSKTDGVGGLAALIYTAVSCVTINTWYRIKITRTLDGEFYVYIKGGAFGSNWVLVDIAGGGGTNPVTDNTYTTSNFLVLDLDVGDRIANIEYTEAVLQ